MGEEGGTEGERERGREGLREGEGGGERKGEKRIGHYCFFFHHTESLLCYQRCVHHHLCLW